MSENILLQLGFIVVAGIFAQWISWRLKLPSILLLIITGIIAGPITNLFDPTLIFSDLLFPVVSIFVAIILFEGGLSLKFSELKNIRNIILRLITVGILITWAFATFAAYYILKLDFMIALLLGAILIVTGPTVIIPLLREIKISGQVNAITKWEGIVNDPIGALTAVLVFESIIATGIIEAASFTIGGIFKTVFLSSIIGLAAAFFLVILLKRKLIPGFLQNPFSLSLVVAVFILSNMIQAESGLFAVTIMGIYLANQKSTDVKHIVEFKENLRILFITFLFIVLASRLKIEQIEMLEINSLIFIAVLIFIVRPTAVFVSTIKTNLNWKEKLFLSWMAPRGIVAAAVASIFAIELSYYNIDEGKILVPIVFLVIVSTILIYGLSSRPLTRALGLSNPDPQGVLVLGAHDFARKIGKVLKANKFNTVLVDTNWHNIKIARMEGFKTFYGSILSEDIEEKIDLSGIGKLLALTPNENVNSLAAMYFNKMFEDGGVYQLSFEPHEDSETKSLSKELLGQLVFGKDHSYQFLDSALRNSEIKITTFTDEYSYDEFLESYKNNDIIKMFLITNEGKLQVYTNENQPEPKEGQKLIYVIEQGNGNVSRDK